MFYYWFTGIICLVALVSTLYLGFSHKNQVASESYTKHTVKNLNSLLILNVLFIVLFSLILMYWISTK